MNKNYNELYNKYIDNTLSRKELEEVNYLLDTDDEFSIGLRTHKFVHNSLFDIPLIQAPSEITSKIMGQIVSNISAKYEKHYFFRVVLAIFGLLFFGAVALFVSYSLNTPDSSETFTLMEYIKPYMIDIIPQISKILKNDLVKPVGGLLSFLILLTFYFLINEHKNFKERLKEF